MLNHALEVSKLVVPDQDIRDISIKSEVTDNKMADFIDARASLHHHQPDQCSLWIIVSPSQQ